MRPMRRSRGQHWRAPTHSDDPPHPARIDRAMSEQRDGLSEEERGELAAWWLNHDHTLGDFRRVLLPMIEGWLARREAAAAAEAVEKALGPVSELADALEAEDDYVRSWKLGRQLRAATARGREEAGR